MEKQYTPEQMVIIDSQAEKAAAAVKDLIGVLGLMEEDGTLPFGSELQIVKSYFCLREIANETYRFTDHKMKLADSITLK